MARFLVAAAAMFAVMYSTQAILPELGRTFDVSPSRAGLSISVVIGALAVGAWFWGPLSDRIGRRASLVLASAAIVPPTVLVALLPLASTLLMRRGLPPEPGGGRRATRLSLPDARRVLRSPTLIAATLAGSSLFFAFMGTFSYVEFRLERPPFSLSPAVAGLAFLVWVMGAAGPAAGRAADRRGWSLVALGAIGIAAAGIAVSLVDLLPLALAGLALITLGNFSGVTAAQLGVAASTERDRGLASALYFSAYYCAGALGAYLPGLAFERWEWPGVAALCLAAYAVGATALLLARRG